MAFGVGPAWVHNLTVEEKHTFFVGEEGAWVHNGCGVHYEVAPHSAPNTTAFPGQRHHGVLDAWARVHVPGYSTGRAPTIMLDFAQHDATRGTFNRWVPMRRAAGLSTRAGSMTYAEARALAVLSMDEAGLPKFFQAGYFSAWDAYTLGAW